MARMRNSNFSGLAGSLNPTLKHPESFEVEALGVETEITIPMHSADNTFIGVGG